jgi:predicted metal-dependent peptidase
MNKSTKKFYKAKDMVRKRLPWLSALVYGMPCTPSDKAQTLEVDSVGRCYYSPEFVEKMPVEHLAYAVVHECFHLCLSHHKRRAAWRSAPTADELLAWNIGADICIQQTLEKDCKDWEPDWIVSWQKYAKVPGIVRGLTSERYADLLMAGMPPGTKPPPMGGSAGDGIPRPAERPTNGVSAEGKLAKVAAEMDKAEATAPGSTPGQLRRAIGKALGTTVDPFKVLESIVSRSVASPLGSPEFTYQKMNRRQTPGVAMRPGNRKVAPECTVVVDTSGSMGPYIERAAAAVAKGLKRIHHPRVICWDAGVQSDKRLASMSQFSWDGGGGTSMDEAIEYADKAKSDCIVVITDGETSWPSERTTARLVVALVKNSRSCYAPPAWAKVVKCWEGADYDA